MRISGAVVVLSAALAVPAALVMPAAAETCRESFVRLYVKGNGAVATKSTVTQQLGNAKPSRNYHYHTGKGDWMTTMIEPDNGMATLVRNGVMYFSANKGKTWKKVRRVDGAEYKAPDDAARKAAIEKSARNVVCGKDVLNGVSHNTVAADYQSGQPKAKYHMKYWVHPKSGWITKVETAAAGFFSSQTMTPAPGLKLPDPN
ncbi:MAG: hypothetical protein KDJ29_11415 [Hyphomicrobiales bacterium]|nr:hypothetical protein [Hyphomicrobiales bacterium]